MIIPSSDSSVRRVEGSGCDPAQVLRIEREMEEVTVFYRPNTMRAEELSRNPVANALAVTFLMQSEQVLIKASCLCSVRTSPTSTPLPASFSMLRFRSRVACTCCQPCVLIGEQARLRMLQLLKTMYVNKVQRGMSV